VLAPILSVAFSVGWGISPLLLAAVPVYLFVGFSVPGPDNGGVGFPAPSPVGAQSS